MPPILLILGSFPRRAGPFPPPPEPGPQGHNDAWHPVILICQASLLGFEQSLEAKPNLSSADPIANRAIQLIQKRHADAELKLRDLAQELAISAPRLSRLLKKGTGAGFREYLRAARLGKAAELLHKPGLSIKEIALAVGYKHVSDFDRHFKKAYGESPGEYRQRLRG